MLSKLGCVRIQVNKTHFFRVMMSAIAVSVAATFNLSLFTEGFIISLAVVILPFLLYLNIDINALLICISVAIISPLMRWTMLLSQYTVGHAFHIVLPEVFFYVIYGIVFYYAYQKNQDKTFNRFLVASLLCDLISNLVEMLIRVGFTAITYKEFSILVLVAFLRVFVLSVLIISIKHYQAFLNEQSHEMRYRNLLAMASTFKSEIYFMKKNMDRIEAVTKYTFDAYKSLNEKEGDLKTQQILLEVAKDIHEIKKDYLRVIQGIEQIYPEQLELEEMPVSEVLKILVANTKEQLLNENRSVAIQLHLKDDFLVKSHFLLMSVLGNLIQNSIESMVHQSNGCVQITCELSAHDALFSVKDNGMGIHSEVLSHVFNPGYTTKYNDKTGDMNRGVGLTVVKSIVEDQFNGSISLKSEMKKGTEFLVRMPKAILEGAL
ncbi:sensor histidine kinase [Fusibacter ferrireducens]|uniref:histidine kinase n=1 Tax=Fusibacter ferrireducens TaxID=2785058 RepID=A0ABR9ZM69_9FIRM|nr:sensor histidine kinase [Fusibacter ferrireducens]MBF4691567.1 sensor histidine kinase [Fusibacter ferrireducens]